MLRIFNFSSKFVVYFVLYIFRLYVENKNMSDPTLNRILFFLESVTIVTTIAIFLDFFFLWLQLFGGTVLQNMNIYSFFDFNQISREQ
jgi:hypothetical protein